MRVLGIDPGGTTGFAELDTETKGWQFYKYGPLEHHLRLWMHLHNTEPDHIVCEEFNYQRRNITRGVNLELVSKEYIGIVKLYHAQANEGLTMQPPNIGRNFWTDEKLKLIGLWGSSTHERDATAHVLHWLKTGYPVLFDEYVQRLRRPPTT